MSDYYTKDELADMPIRTVRFDTDGHLWKKSSRREWTSDHGQTSATPLLLLGQEERETEEVGTPARVPSPVRLSGLSASPGVPVPTLGELLKALQHYREAYAAGRDYTNLRRLKRIQLMIDERIGL